MKLYVVIKNGANSIIKLYDIKKRKSAKEVLASDPKTYFKSFGKARKELTSSYKAQAAEIRTTLKALRKIKKKSVKLIKIKDASMVKLTAPKGTPAPVEAKKSDKKEVSKKSSDKKEVSKKSSKKSKK